MIGKKIWGRKMSSWNVVRHHRKQHFFAPLFFCLSFVVIFLPLYISVHSLSVI